MNNFPSDTLRFKLIVSDFDGTLAGVDHVVTMPVLRMVRKWIDSGKHFTVATGRQYLMIQDECKRMGLIDPVVVRGGAEVVDPVSGHVLHSEFMAVNDVKQLIFLLSEVEIGYSIELDNIIYTNFKLNIEFDKIIFKPVTEFNLQAIPKIHVKPIAGHEGDAELFINKIKVQFPGLNIIGTHNNSFGKGWDVTSVQATKLHGIVKVFEMLGISREQTVGVGDSYNDFPLLEAAGLKIAMENAHDELKAVADVIIPSHEADGVAYLIDNLLK